MAGVAGEHAEVVCEFRRGDHFIADDDEFRATILADGFGVQFDAFEMLESGRTKCWEATRTSRPSMMASVRGSFRVKTVPCPSLLLISSVPRRLSTFCLTTSMPTPRPETP